VGKLVNFAKIERADVVFEIGTGKGAITRKLCEVSGKVISYEVDKRLASEATQMLTEFPNLEIRVDDAFVTEVGNFDVCVTSLPYSESLRFIRWLSLRSGSFKRCVAIIQSEFLNKITASPGDDSYRAVSVIAQRSFNIDRLFEIGKKDFVPEPKVSSVAISLIQRIGLTQPFFTANRIRILNMLFSFKGRLLSAVAKKLGNSPLLEELKERRVETLDPIVISNLVSDLEASQTDRSLCLQC
jgi:16S rRNA A1518/A1519 N6-dimethyltransferase RsmA/KsgA/DIM1 with predicted DNA glycosylase/AP lyase activity